MSINLWLTLKWRALRHAVVDAIAAPFLWNTARIATKRAHQIALARLSIDANADILKTLGTTLVTIVDRQSQAQEAQSKVLMTWLESFKVHELPKTTAVTDRDEYDAEMQQLMDRDGINAGNPADVMKWLEHEAKMATVD
jgi:hypothetical protein